MKEILLTLLQVVFNATRGSSFTGDIAIDDVSVKPGLCRSGKQRYQCRNERFPVARLVDLEIRSDGIIHFACISNRGIT